MFLEGDATSWPYSYYISSKILTKIQAHSVLFLNGFFLYHSNKEEIRNKTDID